MQTEKDRKILVITANRVGDTGSISYKFMLDCKYLDFSRNRMPQMFGRLWRDRIGYNLNVFEGGKGLVLGSGWNDSESFDSEFTKEKLDHIPDCTLLMDKKTFEWWKELCQKYGVQFEHYESPVDLFTS